jgi:hypothetical protein
MIASSVSRRMSSLRKASEASAGFHPTLSSNSAPSQRPGIFSSISRSKDSGSGSLMKRISLSMTGRNLSKESRDSDISDSQQNPPTSMCQSETASIGGSLLRHAFFSSVSRKHSESSAATTPRSYISHDVHMSGRNSPSKTRMSSFRNVTDDGNHLEDAYTSNVSQWNTSSCNTPTVSSKINGWDTSLAEEDSREISSRSKDTKP